MPHDDSAKLRDAFSLMYQDNITQARHHETQRSTVTAALIAIAGAVTGIITFDQQLVRTDLPLSLFLIVLGLFGAIFSAKQYERFDLHMERARRFREALDRELPGQMPISKIKKVADDNNKKHPYLEGLRLYRLWIGIYALISMLGLVLSIYAEFFPIKVVGSSCHQVEYLISDDGAWLQASSSPRNRCRRREPCPMLSDRAPSV